MTLEELNEYFYYKDGNLYNKVTRSNSKKDRLAGTIWKDSTRTKGAHSYRVIQFKKKPYKAHRLIWMYHNGSMPSKQIDHINGDSLDNRIENLREVSCNTNAKNRKLQSNNKTGCHGVTHWKNGRYRAVITVNQKREHIGLFDTLEEAVAARKAKEVEYGFHLNHGRA